MARWWEWLIALGVGFALGLLYAWVISPIRYVDTTPDTLRADFKDQFRTAIASAYAATRNLDRARARLALLGDTDSVQELTAQAQRMLAAGEKFETAQDIARLAADLRSGVASVDSTGPTAPAATSELAASSSATPSMLNPPASSPTAELVSQPLPLITPTARPTRTPIPTAAAPFQLISRDQVCNTNLTEGLLQVSVLDRNRHPMPSVEITVAWDGGEEHFFTGFKPEISDGYADYVMQAGTTYSVRVARSGTPVSDITAPSCPQAGSQTYIGGLKLVFEQP